jgi:hypothetical protein
MSGTPSAVTVGLLLRMLREAFEGPPGPWTYFSDPGPGTGLMGTISPLSVAEVSKEGGPGQTSIAGHVHHVAASLALATREVRGERTSRDRSQSWTVSAVDEAAWTALQLQLRRAYEGMVAVVRSHADWGEDDLGAVIGAIAHATYHLGAIRQRLAVGAT